MNWKTVYIVGREKFNDEVNKHLERSGVDFMPGYDTQQSDQDHELYWVPEEMSMRELKEAIGAKTVFKYRLRFFDSLEQFIETINSTEFTEEERKRVERMRMMDSAA
ncbi:MAG TPA: hypothetical protein VK508_08380 [Cyclobacteriaceae bacterium]|nr:hypothetical protein [Cyclobacteriaceae bacterium]